MSNSTKTESAAVAEARGAEVVPEETDAVFPIRKTESFVSRSISSGKRRTYEVAVVAHGHDNVTLEINGGTTHLSGAGVKTICGLLSDVSKEMDAANKKIHNGKARKGVAGDPDFDPDQPAVVTEKGRVLRTEGQNDEVDGVEAKIRAEARSLDNAETGLDGVAKVDEQVVKDQKAQTEAETKAREAQAKRASDDKAKAQAQSAKAAGKK